MAKQPRNRLEEIAQQMIYQAGLSVEVGEYEFISTATRLIAPKITRWYEAAGLTPPQADTVSKWFYRRKAPDWAIAFLENERSNFFDSKSTNVKLATK